MLRKGLFAALVLLAMLVASSCWGAVISADITMKGGRQGTVKGKIYVKGDKTRIDMSMPARPGSGTTKSAGTQQVIHRGDKKVVWHVMPQSKTYTEMPAANATRGRMNMEQELKELEKSATKKALGTQTVSGYSCKKTLYTYKDKQRGSVTVWYSDKLKFPLKMETKSDRGTWTQELSNIKTTVSDSVFEVPKGYKKVAVPKMGMRRPGGPGATKGGAPKKP